MLIAMRAHIPLFCAVFACVPSHAQEQTSNLITEPRLPIAANQSTIVQTNEDAHASRTVDVIASETSHGYDGWVVSSQIPSVWIDVGRGSGCVRSIAIDFNDQRAKAQPIRTLADVSLVVETDLYQVASVSLLDLVPGRGAVYGVWPITYDDETMTMRLSVKMPYSYSMRIGLKNHGDHPVGVSMNVITSEDDEPELGYFAVVNGPQISESHSHDGSVVLSGPGTLLGVQSLSIGPSQELQCVIDDRKLRRLVPDPHGHRQELDARFEHSARLSQDRAATDPTTQRTFRGVLLYRVDTLESFE